MKKHNILKIVLLTVLVTTLCTWIFPSASFQSQLSIGDRAQLGIFDLYSYFIEVIRYFPYVIFMVLTTGMFYGVAYQIPAYRVLLDKLVKLFSGKESIFLAVIMILIAAIVSVTGLSFGIIFVFPFIISIILLMGYNKLVAAGVTVGSTIVGILGTTLGSSTTSYINLVLGTTLKGEMMAKVILLVIALVLLIYNVLSYAKKTRSNTDKVLELVPMAVNFEKKNISAEKKDVEKEEKDTKKKTSSNKKTSVKKSDSSKTATSEKKSTSKNTTKKSTKSVSTKSTKTTTKKTSTKTRANDSKTESKIIVKPKKNIKIWPFVLVFDLVVVILAISSFDWSGIFNINIFSQTLNAIQEFEIGGFHIFEKLLGQVNAFGEWTVYFEIPTLIILATCFLGFIYGLKLDEFLDGVVVGIKKAFQPMVCMLLLYLVLVIATYNPFQLNITKFLMDITKDFNVLIMSIVAMFSSIFNIECTYVAQSTLPYVATVVTDGTVYPLIAIIFQSIYGLMMLVAPTSVILIGTLSYLDISYKQWLKHIWKLFLELLAVLVVIFFIIFLI